MQNSAVPFLKTVHAQTKMDILEVSEAEAHQWSQYVNSLPAAHFYHDYRWRGVLEKSFGHNSFYLMALEDKRVVGILPLFFIKSKIMPSCLVSLPFLNYGGMLADNETVASLLLDKATNIANEVRAKYIEMRYKTLFPFPLAPGGMEIVTREHKVTMILGLAPDADQQWSRLDKKVRNQIRKAEKSGLTACSGKGELLEKFYRVFARNMRDLGTPVTGKNFFENILKSFPEESRIFVIKYRSKPIASAFTLCHNRILEIPWAASNHSFSKLCPNMFLYWEAIKYAVSAGCHQFDFGRCTKDSGTYHFKKQWGSAVHQLYWQYWAVNESDLPTAIPAHSQFGPAIWVWQHLPLFLTNRLGPIIAKTITIF